MKVLNMFPGGLTLILFGHTMPIVRHWEYFPQSIISYVYNDVLKDPVSARSDERGQLERVK